MYLNDVDDSEKSKKTNVFLSNRLNKLILKKFYVKCIFLLFMEFHQTLNSIVGTFNF